MRGLPGLIALLLLAGVGAPAAAQQIITSARPDKVSVTVYRSPNRSADEAIDRDDPGGFALITETRTIALPAGRAVIRFEGVAGNIFPETAILSGLPQDVREKNLDADLLGPRSLYDRALGRRVLIRRTNPATGKVGEEQAVIRSSADGAAILQTDNGFEVLRCSGLPETLVYDRVPEGLSAKPTLSVETDSARAAMATLTLSYLAGGFDWQADYIVRMRPDGRSADLFAWVTLASNDVTSFAEAGAQVVAGKPNRTSDWSDFGDYGDQKLDLRCWPRPGDSAGLSMSEVPSPPPPAMETGVPVLADGVGEDIIVTSMRRARQEDLGDFKLYRITDPVTVASRAQKQVAFLSKDSVPMTVVYVSDVYDTYADDPVLTLRARNEKADGLGVPLPAGRVTVFEQAGGRQMLVGESSTDDKAIGEDVEFRLEDTVGVAEEVDEIHTKGRTTFYKLTVTNSNPWPIAFEAKFSNTADGAVMSTRTKLGRRDGRSIWSVQVPANDSAHLEYRIKEPD